jgi:hypothetical protein
LNIECDEIIHKEGDFQVLTNFYQSHPELGGLGNAFERYYTAVSMLENMTELSVDYFTSICNATHVSSSVFSNVLDLTQEKLFVYYFYNYENVLEIDLNEELAKGESRSYLGSYFEPDDNQPPNKPDTPWCEKETGNPGVDYKFNFKRPRDPDGNLISLFIDWGDGTDSGWFQADAYTTSVYHNWSEEGTYEVKVKAWDIYGRESEWSDPISISIPKNKPTLKLYLFNFLEQYPNLFQLLRHLLKL